MTGILAMILAGGKGERLHPLTTNRAKPAVPFAGKYRIIDFTLSNCINSNIRKIMILTQYKSFSLDRHIRLGWNVLDTERGDYILTLPPQQRIGKDWYRGTADAIYQNLFVMEYEMPEHVIILSGDHIYKMDYSKMIEYHLEKDADLTIAVINIPKSEASSFGILEMNDDSRVKNFLEKPKSLPSVKSDAVFASMGVYIFKREIMLAALEKDYHLESEHDFGKNIIPNLIKTHKVMGYNFLDENKKETKYWRDVGTIDSYWEANMDTCNVEPSFNLYEANWPIRTYQRLLPPAKFVFAQEFEGGRFGVALDSIVCDGTIISGGRASKSVIGANVRINSYAEISESILFENVDIGRHCRIRKTIIDKGIKIPPKIEIGYDFEEDKRRFFVSPKGVVVVTKDMVENL